MAEQKRVFIAIDISDEARQKIAAYIDDLRAGSGRSQIKWERPEKLHLTLKFLGDINAELLGKIGAAVSTVADRYDPFIMEIAQAGVFPHPANPRILWLGIKSPELQPIVQDIDKACELLGFEREKRQYHPHLTLARIRDASSSRGLIARHLEDNFVPLRCSVSRLAVYESKLLRSGSVYSLVSGHDLGKTR